MTVRKRKSRWQFDLMIRRVRYRGSIPEAQNKQQALKVEAQVRQSIYEGRYGRDNRNTLFSAFVEEVFKPYCRANRKKWKEDEQKCKVFCDFFSQRTFQQISPMLLEKFKKLRRETPTNRGVRKASTVNQDLAVLNRIFTLAIENGYTNDNPLSKVKRLLQGEQRERYLFEDEEVRIREHLNPALIPVFDLGLLTGMRLNEILGLRRSEVNLESNEIVLPPERTKERKKKVIPLNSEASEVVRLLLEESSGERLFGRGFETSWFEKQFRKALKDAKVFDCRFHDLRHTFATRLAEQGFNETAIQSLLGHSSARMTAKYTHATPEMRRKAVDSVTLCRKIVTEEEKTA